MRALSGNSGGEDDRAALSDILAAVLNSGQCGPITQLKGSSGLLEIGRGKVLQRKVIAGRKYKVIESANRHKKSFDRPFVREINCMSLAASAERFNRFLNAFRIAGGDNDLGAVRYRLLSDRQTDPGRTSQDYNSLVLQTVSLFHDFSYGTFLS
jgi:hypothetical protein